MEEHTLKDVNNGLNTNIYSYLETPGGQSSNLFLMSIFQHLCLLDTVVFIHWCLISAIILDISLIDRDYLEIK